MSIIEDVYEGCYIYINIEGRSNYFVFALIAPLFNIYYLWVFHIIVGYWFLLKKNFEFGSV